MKSGAERKSLTRSGHLELPASGTENASRSQPHGPGHQSNWVVPFEPLLDSEDAAKLLRIHPKTLQRLARRGEIQGVRIGKLWRFRASILNEWVNSRIS